MIFLLYSVAGLAFIKFCGCLICTSPLSPLLELLDADSLSLLPAADTIMFMCVLCASSSYITLLTFAHRFQR